MANAAFRSAASGGDSSFTTTTISATVPAGTIQDDGGLIFYSSAAVAPTAAPTHTLPTGWTELGTTVVNGFAAGVLNARLTVYYRTEPATPAAVTLTSSINAAHGWTRVSYDNVLTSGWGGQVVFSTFTGTSAVATGLTTSKENALIGVYVAQGAAQAFTPDATLTERSDNAVQGLEWADAIKVSIGATGNKTGTPPASTDGIMAFVEMWREPAFNVTGTGPRSFSLLGHGSFGAGSFGEFDRGTASAGGAVNYTLSGAVGSYTITGRAATFQVGRLLSGAAGSYAVTGRAATLALTRKLAGAAGSYAVSGQAATFKTNRLLSGAAGSYSLTGVAGTLTYTPGTPGAVNYTLSGAAGSYSLTGNAATFKVGHTLSGAAGAYSLTGRAATLTYTPGNSPVNYALSGEAGSYALIGNMATLVHTGKSDATGGWGTYYPRRIRRKQAEEAPESLVDIQEMMLSEQRAMKARKALRKAEARDQQVTAQLREIYAEQDALIADISVLQTEVSRQIDDEEELAMILALAS